MVAGVDTAVNVEGGILAKRERTEQVCCVAWGRGPVLMCNACMQRQPGVTSAHTQQACTFKHARS